METKNVTRVEVIDHTGRSYVNWNILNKVTVSLQDDGRTLKVFVDRKNIQSKEVVVTTVKRNSLIMK
jgi:hypothetical protein